MIIVSFHDDVAILLFFCYHFASSFISHLFTRLLSNWTSISEHQSIPPRPWSWLTITRACQNITLDKAEEYFRTSGYIVQYCIMYCHVVRMSSVQCIDHHSLWLSWFIDYSCMIMTVTWTWMWHQQHSFKLQWVWNYLLRPTHTCQKSLASPPSESLVSSME